MLFTANLKETYIWFYISKYRIIWFPLTTIVTNQKLSQEIIFIKRLKLGDILKNGQCLIEIRET